MNTFFQKYYQLIALSVTLTVVGVAYSSAFDNYSFGKKFLNDIENCLNAQDSAPESDNTDYNDSNESIVDEVFIIGNDLFSKTFISIPTKVNYVFHPSFWYCITKPVLKQPPKC